MSFILDALKKSETERQRQNVSGFADVPDGVGAPRAPRWLWVLGGLLAINLVVLLGVMLKPGLQPTKNVATPVESNPVNESHEATFSELVDDARRKQPEAVVESTDDIVPEARPAVEGRSVSVTKTPQKIATSYATFNELRANGTIVLPDLHLDIHVYSEQPEERFIFVNMSKYREHARLAEGPLVREITPEGVVLEHLGNGFLLPRE